MITVSVGFENNTVCSIERKGKGKSLIAFPEKYVCLDLETDRRAHV